MTMGHVGRWADDEPRTEGEAMLDRARIAKFDDEAQEKQAGMIKIAGSERPTSNAIGSTPEDLVGMFNGEGAVTPEHDPHFLAWLIEHSSAVRQCVDAYVTNIDGFGHRLEPIIDPDAADADDRIANALSIDGTPPTPEEVQAFKAQMRVEMRAERARLALWLENVCLDYSFVTLRRFMRQDKEGTGNAYWEKLRSDDGRPLEYVYLPSHSIRSLPLDDQHTEVDVWQRASEVSFQKVRTRRRFRRYLQIVSHKKTWFKEDGDPRVLSRRTGQYFESVEALKKVDEKDEPATEIVHFKVHSSRSVYGSPRWIGTMLVVLGLREYEEINRDYAENKGVPPGLLLVAGGKAGDDDAARIEDHLESNVKGRKNFHRIAIVTAQPFQQGDGAQQARVSMQFVDLTGAMLKDAVFVKFDERGLDKVGFAFRLPKLLRGDVQDVNRAAADATLVFGEQQVFAPERQEFDDWFNRKVVPELGIRYWKFVSNGPIPRDSSAVADLITKMSEGAAAITINEARTESADVFNHARPRIAQPWADMPLPLARVWLQTQPVPAGANESPELIEARKSALRAKQGQAEAEGRAKVSLEAAAAAEERSVAAEERARESQARVLMAESERASAESQAAAAESQAAAASQREAERNAELRDTRVETAKLCTECAKVTSAMRDEMAARDAERDAQNAHQHEEYVQALTSLNREVKSIKLAVERPAGDPDAAPAG